MGPEVAVTTPERETGAVINTPEKAPQSLVVTKESKCWGRGGSRREKMRGLQNSPKLISSGSRKVDGEQVSIQKQVHAPKNYQGRDSKNTKTQNWKSHE